MILPVCCESYLVTLLIMLELAALVDGYLILDTNDDTLRVL